MWRGNRICQGHQLARLNAGIRTQVYLFPKPLLSLLEIVYICLNNN